MRSKTSTIDGNTAAAHVAYAFSEVAAIYPITPSSPMAELAESWAAHERKNLFGRPIEIVELQSEGGAAGAVHGSLSAGAMTTTFTASQGLLLMIPVMHKVAGEMLPTVFHVTARALAAQSLSIFGDHSDVMGTRNTGFALLASASVQEVMDLALVSHLATIDSSIPFLHFFDGFRTSHEVQKVEMIDYETMAGLVNWNKAAEFRNRALRPEKPILKVGAQNPDVYFQGRETVTKYYEAVPGIVQNYMDKVAAVTGRSYHLFDYVGAPDAERVIVVMGSGAEVVEETVNYMVAKGEKVGLVKVRLYRPFAVEAFRKVLPSTVKKIAVLDRTKEPGSIGEPLYMDVVAALKEKDITIIGGRYGLGSKEFTPSQAYGVFKHLKGACFHDFTVGINDDVTNRSIPVDEQIDTEPQNVVRCIFWGLGSDGTVGANKNSIKIIGDHTDMYAQGYFSYDSKKSGGITVSHLRFGKTPITSPYLISKADFVAVHNPAYIGRYDLLKEIKDGGTFLLNSEFSNEEVFDHLTKEMQETIIAKKIRFFNINALKISEEVGLGKRINTVMQAAFFIISGVLPQEEAIKLIKETIKKSYEAKGEKIVQMNWAAVDRASQALQEIKIPAKGNGFAPVQKLISDDAGEYAKKIVEPTMLLKGDDIPVSAMPLDGRLPTNTARLEKRGIAPEVPKWLSEKCVQCTICSMVCPHAAVRTKQIAAESLKGAPESFKTIKSKTKNESGLEFKVQVYPEDCTGCGSCVSVCPAHALEFRPIKEEREAGETKNAEFFDALPDNVTEGVPEGQFKWTQLRKPLFEFSGACEGCGETPYLKLLSQLFGEKMIVANATGCSSIYSGTFPTTPYAQTKEGRGPAWANSLFEDNAEYGFGMRLAVDALRNQVRHFLRKALELGVNPSLAEAMKDVDDHWEKNDVAARNRAERVTALLPDALKGATGELKDALERVAGLKDYLVDKSIWCIGGDGWAYDIGYGGLDHVLAANRNLNVLVLDTEVYSNTGGQASKSTPLGSVAKFASAGKRTGKKDLGLIAMTYGYIYVASVSLGANMNQVVKALMEAEAYPGPSLVIAYAPCIAHGFNMRFSIAEEKKAVTSGYWPLFRYNPLLKEEGKNPFIYESKDPTEDMEQFLLNEGRYTTLKRQFPAVADKLFQEAIKFKQDKHEFYKKFGQF